jgi:hypothetical protein
LHPAEGLRRGDHGDDLVDGLGVLVGPQPVPQPKLGQVVPKGLDGKLHRCSGLAAPGQAALDLAAEGQGLPQRGNVQLQALLDDLLRVRARVVAA